MCLDSVPVGCAVTECSLAALFNLSRGTISQQCVGWGLPHQDCPTESSRRIYASTA
jgi:hypothetical protein